MSDSPTGIEGATPDPISTSAAAPADAAVDGQGDAPVRRSRTRAPRTTKKVAPPASATDAPIPLLDGGTDGTDAAGLNSSDPVTEAAAPPAKKAARKRTTKKAAAAADAPEQPTLPGADDVLSASADGSSAAGPAAGQSGALDPTSSEPFTVDVNAAAGAEATGVADTSATAAGGVAAEDIAAEDIATEDTAPTARKRPSRRRAAPVTSPFDIGAVTTGAATRGGAEGTGAGTAPDPAAPTQATDAPAAARTTRTRRTPARATTDLFVAPTVEPATPSSSGPIAEADEIAAPDAPAEGATAPRQRRRRTAAAVPLFQAPAEVRGPSQSTATGDAPATETDAVTVDQEQTRAPSRSSRSRSRSRAGAAAAPDSTPVIESALATGTSDASPTSAPDTELDLEPLEADALHADTLDGDVIIDALEIDSVEDTADGDPADGHTAAGDPAAGDSADGNSADGNSAQGDTATVETLDDDVDADADADSDDDDAPESDSADDADAAEAGVGTTTRRRRRRGGRGRRRKPAGEDGAGDAPTSSSDVTDDLTNGSPSGAASDTELAETPAQGSDTISGSAIDEAVESAAPTTRGRSRSRSRGGAVQPAELGESPEAAPGEQPTADDPLDGASAESGDAEAAAADGATDQPRTSSSSRRRRSRRRAGETIEAPGPDDPPVTVVRVREPRPTTDDDVTSLKGSTRLEAKKQRRRDGRDQGRRRSPIITEAEFLARRESVDRTMLVRQSGSRTQIAVLEDGVLVEHYVAHASQTSSVGNVYLGKVQNVLPAMEAAFIDIGKGRNAVLYAGEVAWSRMGLDGKARRMESVLSSGQSVLVQVTKDPVGSKGARLTGLVSLPGRFLVYAPGGSMSGISRKLPEKERARLKAIVKKVFPDEASVIIRTAAEGATEEELNEDIHRLEAQWLDIEAKAATAASPARLYAEPDLAIKVVRDMFNEDFASLVISGDDAWETLQPYVSQVAPDLADRLSRWTSESDVFAEYRVDEQIAKALDRKVWLPSGGSLVIDRTEAMTVVDVNTGKFTGSGGNLEATVTKNNLEAAEEIVRQIRLRDIGGIIVIDFIDMVLENNRDLVLRRLVECLGRDRTRHQVAEVTSLGLVQMTRKRVGQGLLDVFSEPCEHCNGRGVKIHYEPVESVGGDPHEQTPQPARGQTESGRSGRSRRGTPAAAAVPADGLARPGPADLIRAVAMAAAASRAAVAESDNESPDGAEQSESAESLEVFDATREDSGADVIEAVSAFDTAGDHAVDDEDLVVVAADDTPGDAVGDSTDSNEAIAGADDASAETSPAEAVDQSTTAPEGDAVSGDVGSEHSADGATRGDAEELDTESPESGHAPARRSRRGRSTRRPAGPPRPVSSTLLQTPGVITPAELPAIAATIAPPEQAPSNGAKPSANGGGPSAPDGADASHVDEDFGRQLDADQPVADEPVFDATVFDSTEPDATDADATEPHETVASETLTGQTEAGSGDNTSGSTAAPTARAPRRRATRPAGAPTT